jgi:hypothetical protein
MHSAVKLERQLQAVFVSYAVYGEWNPEDIASHLSEQCSETISFRNFVNLARDAKSVRDVFPDQDILQLFNKHTNPVSFWPLAIFLLRCAVVA